MKNHSIRFVLAVLTLVAGAAAEELLPKFCGLGVPVLLAAIPVFATRGSVTLAVSFALAAGFIEDALCGLPPMTSVSFFLFASVLVRWSRLFWPVALAAFPVYEAWISVWGPALRGGLLVRFLVAIPVGAATAAAVTFLLLVIFRKAGADEEG